MTAYPIGMALPSRKDLQQIDIGDDMPIVNDADPKIRETVKERRAERKEVHQLGGGGGSKIYKPSTYYMYDFTIVFSVNPLSSFGVYSVI